MQNVGDMHEDKSSYDSVSPAHNTSEHTTEPTSNSFPPVGESQYSFRSLILTVAVILAFALGIRFFVMAPYLVEGASMEETFHTFDYLMVDRITYRFENPQRGDVVVLKFPLDTSRSFIKRIIGLPGETVVMSGQSVTIKNDAYPDGFVLEEQYISPQHASETELSITLGEEEYFVLGDNRKESADSRYWGSLPANDIIGRPLIRIYPLSSLELFPGEARYARESAESSLMQ